MYSIAWQYAITLYPMHKYSQKISTDCCTKWLLIAWMMSKSLKYRHKLFVYIFLIQVWENGEKFLK